MEGRCRNRGRGGGQGPDPAVAVSAWKQSVGGRKAEFGASQQLRASPQTQLPACWLIWFLVFYKLHCWLMTEQGVFQEGPQVGSGIRELWQAGPVSSCHQCLCLCMGENPGRLISQNYSGGKVYCKMCEVLWKAQNDYCWNPFIYWGKTQREDTSKAGP